MTTSMPDTKDISEKSNKIVAEARSIVIADNDQYQGASGFLRVVMAMKKEIIDTFSSQKTLAHETHRAICDAESKHLKPMQEAEALVKRAIGGYIQQQEVARRQAEDKALKEAQARAEEERQKLVRLAEDERLRQAEAMARDGKNEAAQAILEAPIVIDEPVIVVEQTMAAPKASGISGRKDYTYMISDASLLPREFLMPDEKRIGQMVRMMGAETRIPGVVVTEKIVVSARAAS